MIASAYGRARQAALHLSLMLEVIVRTLAEKRGLPRYVKEASMRAAIAFLDEHFLPSAARVFEHVGQGSDPDADVRRIANYIARHSERAGRFTVKVLRESPYAACARKVTLREEAVLRLEAAGCVRRAPQLKRVGRLRGDYVAHPAFIAAATSRRGGSWVWWRQTTTRGGVSRNLRRQPTGGDGRRTAYSKTPKSATIVSACNLELIAEF
jgi:hypothetical protein